MAQNRIEFTSSEEIVDHPAFPTAIWHLVPDKKGFATVAQGRRCGPLEIYYQIHGHGPIKVLVSSSSLRVGQPVTHTHYPA